MDKDSVKKLKENPFFEQFQEVILMEMTKLNDISELKDLSNNDAGEMVKARVMALDILQDILSPFLNLREKAEHTTKEIQDAKRKVGL